MRRVKKFKVGDRVRVRAGSRDCGGAFAGREGTIEQDDYGPYYCYLVVFDERRRRPFHANELVLFENKRGLERCVQ